MAGSRQSADSARDRAASALEEGRRKSGGDRPRAPSGPAAGPAGVLALQRAAGNSAVSALMAARLRSPGERAVTEIDAALEQLKRDEPVVEVVETGLRSARAAGVPVDLEGQKPPASALAVSPTGFGPAQVPAKKAVPPPKPVPAKSPLGKVAAKAPAPAKKAAAPAAPASKAGPASGEALAGGGGSAPVEAAGAAGGLSADKLMQPPVKPGGTQPGEDPAFRAVTG